jgi:ribosomal protein L11
MSEFKEASEDTTGSAKIVHLISQEGESFDVPVEVAKMSALVSNMIDEEADSSEIQDIPLPNVKSIYLSKVVEFCQHHKANPMEEIEKVSEISFLLYFIHSLTIFCSYLLAFKIILYV